MHFQETYFIMHILTAVPGVVTTAASGNPFPIPFAMVTEDGYWVNISMYMHCTYRRKFCHKKIFADWVVFSSTNFKLYRGHGDLKLTYEVFMPWKIALLSWQNFLQQKLFMTHCKCTLSSACSRQEYWIPSSNKNGLLYRICTNTLDIHVHEVCFHLPISGTTPCDSNPQKWLPSRPKPVWTWIINHSYM